MSATVFIPTPLRQFTGGAHALSATGATVAAVLDAAIAAHPKLKDNLLAATGKLQPFVHVFVNGRDAASAGGLNTPVPEGAEVLIVQAISGG